MDTYRIIRPLIVWIFGVAITLTPQPLLAQDHQAAPAEAERDTLVAAWSLPGLIMESSTTALDWCVRAGFAVSEWSQELTGTLTYADDGSVSYQPAPHDRLRVIFADERTFDFDIQDAAGYTEAGPDGFLNNDFRLRCRATAADQADLLLVAERAGSDGTLITTGSITFANDVYQIDTEATSDIYFESSFGGSEYRSQTALQGEVSGPGFALTLDETFFFNLVALGDESASTNQRRTNSQWTVAGQRYAFEGGGLNRSFRDGQPSRKDSEWQAFGAIRRGNQRVGTVSGRLDDDHFEVWATLPEGELRLEAIALTGAGATTPPAEAAGRGGSTDPTFDPGAPLLPAGEDERVRLAHALYRQMGLDEDTAQFMVQTLGVGDDAMATLVIVAARSFVVQHRYEDARALLEQTLADLPRFAGLADYEASLLSEIGKVDYYLGDLRQALAHLEAALAQFRAMENDEQQAVVLANLALIHESQAEYEAALAAYLEALDHQRSFEEQVKKAESGSLAQELATARLPLNLGTIYNNIGSLYQTLGEHEQAVSAYTEALAIQQAADDLSGEAVTLHNLGRLYTALDRRQEAVETLQAALAIARELGNRLAEGHIFGRLGDLYAANEEYDMALERYETALERFQEVGNTTGVAFTQNDMAVLFLEQEVYDQAEPLLLQAQTQFDALGYRADQAAVLSNLGYLYERQGDTAAALEHYRTAIDLVESIQGQLRVEEVKSAFLADQSNLYAYLVDFLWREGEAAEALDYTERARARAFLDLIANPRVDLYRAGDDPLVAQAEELRQRMVGLQNVIANERAKALEQQDQMQIDTLSGELEKTRGAYEQLLTRLKLTNPDYAEFVTAETVSLGAVQTEILAADITFISYFVLDERTLAWVIDQEGYQVVELAVSREELVDQVHYLRNLIAERDFDADSAADLYDTLFAPLTPHIRHSNLVVVPHDVLHYLPFGALWNAEQERFLIDDYVLTMAPSASTLPLIDTPTSSLRRLAAFGNPDGTLPHAEAEVKAVAQLFATQPVTGTRASEGRFYTQAGRADILHLAAHGRYDPFHPLHSYLALAADSRQDGRLEVQEILGLDLSGVNLVVLSACETALGTQTAGDELVGLTRAFLYAGAPAVVTTLWPVEDEATRALMVTFYRHLHSGMTPAQALQRAQSAVAAQPQWHSPYFWAAFTLTGGQR